MSIKYTRYPYPVVVQVNKNDTKQWDFSGSTWADIADASVDTFMTGKELEIVGDAVHPLGTVFVMSAYAMGDGDVKDPDFQPHKTWGTQATAVTLVRELRPRLRLRKRFAISRPANPSVSQPEEPQAQPAWYKRLYDWIALKVQKVIARVRKN